jgi:general secretion pathway protein G
MIMARMFRRRRGFTLVEMMVTLAVLAVLASAIMPIAKTAIKREKEIELRRNLRIIREAIDAYKKLADEKKMEVEEDTEGYPPDLEILVEGVEAQVDTGGQAGSPGSPAQARTSPAAKSAEKKIIKFLRRVPRDPMTDSLDWGLRSYQDESDSEIWGGENVYDVYTKSNATALDGTKYKDW